MPSATGDHHEIDNTLRNTVTAIACYEYGCKAPLDQWEGNSSSRMLRAARASAAQYKRDTSALAERMEHSVNKIGSTAREYMTGNILSGVLRGVASGDPVAELMLKMGVR